MLPPTGEGEVAAYFLETLYGYDVMNRQNRVVDPTGTISRIVFDSRGLALSNWVDTNDDGATDHDPTGGALSWVESTKAQPMWSIPAPEQSLDLWLRKIGMIWPEMSSNNPSRGIPHLPRQFLTE